ncbi:MAG TPA: hypothetical protein VJ464_20065 [Blastocatellia bacterium]|nr:hypothetical protein [Blastocatellia bacterium]
MSFKPSIAWLMAVVICIGVAPVAAFQSAAKKEDAAKARDERRKKALSMTDEIIKDAQALQLPENRLRLLVQTASAVWAADEKRARLLIKSAQESLKELQAAIDNKDPQYLQLDSFVSQMRSEMLNTVAQHDPELALEMLRATRPSNGGQLPAGQDGLETQLEMQLAHRLADKDTAKALEMGERVLANGVSYDVFNLANALNLHSRQAGQKLFDDMLARLQTENYATNRAALYVALNLLHTWAQPRTPAETGEQESGAVPQLRLSDQAARDICGMILRAVLDNSASGGASGRIPMGSTLDVLRQLQPLMPTIEKLAPRQAAPLQARMAEMQRFTEMQNGPWAKAQELINNGSVNDLLAAAGNWPPEMQNQFFQAAVWKAQNDGKSELARQIMEEKITDPRLRQEMQANLDRQTAERMINEGKLAEARALVPRLPTAADRIGYLIRLATMVIGKGDKNEAEQLLSEAMAQTGNRAENYPMLYAQLAIANAYRGLDPSKSTPIIESAIDRLNELTSAAATLNGFDVQYFRNDEFVLSNGNPLSQLLQQIGAQLGGIAEKDADQARTLAERVGRLEMKTWLLVTMLPPLLSEQDEASIETLHLSPRRTFQSIPFSPRASGVIIDK